MNRGGRKGFKDVKSIAERDQWSVDVEPETKVVDTPFPTYAQHHSLGPRFPTQDYILQVEQQQHLPLAPCLQMEDLVPPLHPQHAGVTREHAEVGLLGTVAAIAKGLLDDPLLAGLADVDLQHLFEGRHPNRKTKNHSINGDHFPELIPKQSLFLLKHRTSIHNPQADEAVAHPRCLDFQTAAEAGSILGNFKQVRSIGLVSRSQAGNENISILAEDIEVIGG